MAERSKRRDPGKERFWRGVIRRWQRSGQTIVGFCREAKLSVAAFHWWRRELSRRDRTDADIRRKQRPRSLMPFVPVQVTSPPSAFSGRDVIEIALPHGAVVRVGSDVNRDALTTVMAVLEDSAC